MNAMRMVSIFTGCILMVACASVSSAKQGVEGFVGAWSVKQCDEKNPQLECGTFVLYLAEDQGLLCGEHFVATPGAAKLDEGEPGTVLGAVSGSVGMLVISSGRNDARYMASVEKRGAMLAWKRIGMVASGSDNEPPVIPGERTLHKDDSPGIVKHFQEFQANGCAWPDWVGGQ